MVVKPKIIRPNAVKLFVYTLVSIFVFYFVLAIIIMTLQWFGVFDSFVDLLVLFNININFKAFVVPLLGTVGIATVVVLLINYGIVSNLQYVVMANKIICQKAVFLIFKVSEEIEFEAIDRVFHQKEGLLASLFDIDTIYIVLTGSQQKPKVLHFVDEGDEVMSLLQERMKGYQEKKQYLSIERQKGLE